MHDRHGAKQPQRFDPSRAARLDDPERFSYLPPAALIELLRVPRGSRLLDFGTGTGTYAIEIARLRPDVHVIAFDEQPQMLALLQQKLEREPLANVEPCLTQGSMEIRADRVLAINVLHEMGDAALGQLRQMLSDEELALFVDWNADVERPVGPPRDHVYSPDEARRRLTEAGFDILEQRMFPFHYALLAQRGT